MAALANHVSNLNVPKSTVLAAHRAGNKTVIFPEENRKDLEEVPETVRKDLNLVFAERMVRVIDTALAKRPKKAWPAKAKHSSLPSIPKQPVVPVPSSN